MTGLTSVFGRPLKVTVTGGGPVGLTFALLLESLIGGDVSIAVHDARWTQEDGRIVWKGEKQQNARRHLLFSQSDPQVPVISESFQS